MKLRKWTLNDKEALIELMNHADRTYLANRLPFPYTEKNAEWWLNMVNEHEGKDGIFRAIVENEKIIGTISVEQKSDVYYKDGEIGYLLDKTYWSKGIMSEAVHQICEIAFAELDIIRISANVYQPNTASCKVLEKNHFILEGIMKKAVVKNNKIYDLCVYGRVKE